MDNIWDRKVIGRGGDEKTEWPRRTDKRRTLKPLLLSYVQSKMFAFIARNIKKQVLFQRQGASLKTT